MQLGTGNRPEFYTCDFKKKTPAVPTGAKNDWSNQLLLLITVIPFIYVIIGSRKSNDNSLLQKNLMKIRRIESKR